MFLARVIGSVWATRKHRSLERKRLLLVHPLRAPELQPVGKPSLAVCDRIDAGTGDLVLVMDEGSSARQILGDSRAPVRTIVVGVVDLVDVSTPLAVGGG